MTRKRKVAFSNRLTIPRLPGDSSEYRHKNYHQRIRQWIVYRPPQLMNTVSSHVLEKTLASPARCVNMIDIRDPSIQATSTCAWLA